MDAHNVEAEDLLCDESFQRYVRGEEMADIQYWEAWIKDNPGKQSVVATAVRMHEMLSLGQGNRLEQLTALKDAIARRLRFKEQVLTGVKATGTTSARVVKFKRRDLLKYAAGIILLFAAGSAAYISMNVRSVPQPPVYDYYTGMHGHKTIVLPDSSIVMLNENSHLSISKGFNAQHRQVSVTGEAFFDIKHNARSPFLVKTAQYTIRVLGTTFNVKSYPEKDTTETTLLTGRVEIVEGIGDETDSKVMLKPCEKFVLNKRGMNTGMNKAVLPVRGKVVKSDMDTVTRHLSETSWARRKMEIKDRTLEEIAGQLQTWYGIKIRFEDNAVRNYRYTATFDDETIFTALKYLQQSYPFTYTIKDDCIAIARN